MSCSEQNQLYLELLPDADWRLTPDSSRHDFVLFLLVDAGDQVAVVEAFGDVAVVDCTFVAKDTEAGRKDEILC